MKSLFVIAAFNESKSIQKVLYHLLKENQKVLVVDDGSTDDTWKILESYGSRIYSVQHPINMGQGAALQTGLDAGKLLNPDFIVTFDADGQHSLEDALMMIRHLESHPEVEIALGSRFLGTAVNIPLSRVITLKLAILFTRIFSGLHLTDAHNGLRAMRKSFYSQFRFHQPKMEHASEIVDYISIKKINFVELPVTIHYTDYSLQKGQRWTNSIRMAVRLLGEKFF